MQAPPRTAATTNVVGGTVPSEGGAPRQQVEILFSGIGGQGIQLMAKTLATAATQDGMEVMLSASYGAEIRGGHSDATLAAARSGLRAVPIAPSVSHAIMMHDMSWPSVREKLKPGAFVVVNSNTMGNDVSLESGTVVTVDADEQAAAIGAPKAASFVALGAFCGATGFIECEALKTAMRTVIPSYRTDMTTSNAQAIDTGFTLGKTKREQAGI